MRRIAGVLLGLICLAAMSAAQTADELIAKNLQARGGIDKIKAVRTLRMKGKINLGDFTAEVGREAKRPGMLRETFGLQGMTSVQAFDGSTAWQIQPFQGRRDPELMGEDDARDLLENSDLDGPLVDYQQKGNRVEYLGKDIVDGDDAYRLKVSLKNGDIFYYYLDPETYMTIREERQQFIRGSVRESLIDMGSYKLVAGVYYPFSLEFYSKNDPNHAKVSVDRIDVNVPIDDSDFKMPAAPAKTKAEEPRKH